MRNYVQKGDTLTLPAPADVESGDVAIVGSFIGIASGDAASGDDMDLALVGVFTVPKVATDAFTVGAKVYWDAGAELATTDDDTGGNPLLGVATAAAGNPSSTVDVRLNGAF